MLLKIMKIMLKKILGNNIKYYRYAKKLTQEQLGDLLNVSCNYIGRIERGQHNPSLDKIQLIADILEVKSYELFKENDYNLKNRVNLK